MARKTGRNSRGNSQRRSHEEISTEKDCEFGPQKSKRKRCQQRGVQDQRISVGAEHVENNSQEEDDLDWAVTETHQSINNETEAVSGSDLLAEEEVDNEVVGDDSILRTGVVPQTVMASRGVASGGSTTSSLQLSSVANGGDGSTVVSAISRGSSRSGRKSEMSIIRRQKYGEVKGAVRGSVFRVIKFLGKVNSSELNWDRQIAGIVYNHLNMDGWESSRKKSWWEEDNNSVPRWIAETIAMKRSEVTQGVHKRFLGKWDTCCRDVYLFANHILL